MASSLVCSETQSRVSSVLNRDVKQYGKKYMFDCNEETCWNSDQGECQWVSLEFPQSVKVSELKVQFQGGFSAKSCRLEGCPKDGALTEISQFYPEDNNSLQGMGLLHGAMFLQLPKIEVFFLCYLKATEVLRHAWKRRAELRAFPYRRPPQWTK